MFEAVPHACHYVEKFWFGEGRAFGTKRLSRKVVGCVWRPQSLSTRTAVQSGVSHTTFRHLTEVLNLNGTQRGELRQLLISDRPSRHDAPLWSIGT
ncbi:hypothetical protein Sfulv_25260 [Streptomyces fulvorobeus]|uniref:Uncharacterized protein n=1 Tax=Streptomyces fulvorobeus TaxID=284028 RepID=A0A7J0C597_9ACTN|nr:hypothetical protein Sfulv_25260 [Streptomyces fulvorobeus]